MAHAGVAASVDDGCNSFDDDLGWILDKLTERAGGSFGLIVRFIEGIDTPAVMARTASAASLSQPALVQITQRLRSSLADQSDSETQELSMSEPLICWLCGPLHRLLHLPFGPLPASKLWRQSVARSSSSLLHGIAHVDSIRCWRYLRLWWLHRPERRRASAFGAPWISQNWHDSLIDGGNCSPPTPTCENPREGDGMRNVGRQSCHNTRLMHCGCRQPFSTQFTAMCDRSRTTPGGRLSSCCDVVKPEGRHPHGSAARGRAVIQKAAAIVYVLHRSGICVSCLAPV